MGQRFVGGAQEFRDVLCKYAIQCGFQFTYVKNKTTKVTAVCAMRDERGCLLAIHRRPQRANSFFYIKRFSDVHSCDTNVRTSKNSSVSSDLVSSTISEIVRGKTLTQPYEVVTILKRDYGPDVSYHVVWLGVEKANAVIYRDHSLLFDQLQWYSDAVMRYNLGSYVNIDYDMSSQYFCRFFVSFAAYISGYNSCRPLLFLDGTFLKGKYKDQLLEATAKDGNNGLFLVAFAIVDSKTTINWSWFLHELGKDVDAKCQITFILDHNLGLLEAMPKVFPSAHHGCCLQHLKNNIIDQMKGIDNGFRDHLVSSLGDCAYEPTVVGFHEKIEK
ncbi:uncharacterized protein LOC114293541 [Camellia sinensis]|uniref:uncharacterized protein LOC114293541 n=1 Tax=Camellia sinensis TaxID=4442 RepID=UPI001035D767|nr:uncharacterized protein LOC114293541 [Camellia sinensis]